MTRKYELTTCALCLIWLMAGLSQPLSAQNARPVQRQHESLLLDIDSAATKKIATVQTHLRVGQLTEAVELLRSIGEAHQGKLIATGSGRYVNVQNHVRMLAAGLPPEGLKIYREQLDPVLKPGFEAAREAADETRLLKVLQQGYCCSFADDALLLLGDLAWDAGDVWRARSYWRQILPPPKPKAVGEPVRWLAYPDSDLDPGMVVARLILCSIQSGDRIEIQRELAGFAEHYAQVTGHLAGRDGNLLQILRDVAKEADNWPVPIRTRVVETFAGSPRRYHVDSQGVELGSLRWQTSLKPFGEEQRRGFQQASLGGLCYFPVVYGDIVLVNNDEYINAYRLQTGKPAWSDDPTDARAYTSVFSNQKGGTAPRAFGEGLVGNIGLPRYSMTIADGRLYARMGSVQPYSTERGGLLVCLDLARGEGKLVWETFAQTLDQDGGGWIFEGSPLVMGGRAYVGLRRLSPQPQANVACFDALTGKLIWNRKLCVGQTNPNFSEFDVNQHLLTWGEGTLFYTTHMGAIAALDPRTGTVRWIVSYPRVEDTKLRHEHIARLQRGPLPAMFADGVLYAAPMDSDELLAFDAETGLLKWKRSFNSPIQGLLGVANGLVFATGAELWGIATISGKVVWKVGDPDPESYGFGRGLLVEDAIYWPTHEEVFIIDQETGAIRSRLPLFAVHGQYGGNLILADDHLLIAQPDRLAVFSNQGPPPDRTKIPKRQLTGRPSPAARAWQLARQAVEDQQWGAAADQYRTVGELSQAGDEWMARPLSQVAAEREIDARLRQAWQLTRDDPTQAAGTVLTVISTALRPAESRGGPASLPARDGILELRFPNATPPEMVNWLTSQSRGPLQALGDAANSRSTEGSGPGIEQVIENQDVDRRVSTRHHWSALDDGVVQPVVHKPVVESASSSEAWPLRRHWVRTCGVNCQIVYPVGTPPSDQAACVFVNQSPVTCFNLHDGTPRFRVNLSHRLQWAGFAGDRLILATEHELRAVSVSTGTTVWRQRVPLTEPGTESSAPDLIAVRYHSERDLFSSKPQCPFMESGSPLVEFSLSGDTLLVRQGDRRVVAWDVQHGRMTWQYAATRGLAMGWGLTDQHVVLGQLSPACLVVLNRTDGSEVERYPTDVAGWLRPPCVRADGTLLTVGPLGRIDSWSKPGAA